MTGPLGSTPTTPASLNALTPEQRETSMKINRRKATWYPKITSYTSQAVSTNSASIERLEGDQVVPTEFALRNPHIVSTLDGEQDYVRYVRLDTVHEGRQMITEMTPGYAADLGYALVDTSARARVANYTHMDGFTSDREPLEAAVAAHKRAQQAAADRAVELIRMVWPALRIRYDQILGFDSEVFGHWYIVVDKEGATARVEAKGVPARAWGTFVTSAVDRAWFHKGRFRGAEDWARARPGQYEAKSHRAQYGDRLQVGIGGEAVELVLQSVEVRKLARGLAYMLATGRDSATQRTDWPHQHPL
ncbi:hypothetical protein [Streptomyces noursei]|uniref:hypothetical protein n=1 Tax=Streptomyces noursei TaxID=1971 RepID=UPI001675F2CD|nr:hypothetical protein [Streptomyces noursei]MCZ1019723.1 hypothetical protein [Streptomyces noursei]GGX51023.1 hypothetical protein GCM10010341_85760 [Streptomyces noursei]